MMGALVIGFVDVKDLGEALSDTEHHLVCVNFSLMIGNLPCLCKVAIIVLIYSPCHKRFAVSLVWDHENKRHQLTYAARKSLAATNDGRYTAQPRKPGVGRSIEIFRVAIVERRFVECGIIFQ